MLHLLNIPVRRIRKVVSVFYDLEFGLWIRRLRLSTLVPIHKRLMGLTHKEKHLSCPIEETYEEEYEEKLQELPKNFRLALERLGGTFVKLGQILSLRADLVTQAVADELRKLQDEVPPFPTSEAKKIIEKELGKPMKKLFKEFDKKPVGSASLAQVYHAMLPNGEAVAVKVLRPNIQATFRQDILILKWIAQLLENHLPATRVYQPQKTIDEFEEWTTRELNLLNEATNIEHFRSLFAGEEHFFVPGVIWDYTTEKVLTMEFSEGVRLDDFKAYPRRKCSRKIVAAHGIQLGFAQFFEHGFFHGDPHPGNFFVIRNNTLCLHDFGIVGRIDDETRRELISCFVNFLDKDADGTIKHLLHMATTNESSDLEGFKQKVRVILERWFYGPYEGERVTNAFYRTVTAGTRHGVYFPSNLILLAKAIVTMESMGLMLNPKMNMVEELRPYLRKLMTLELRPKQMAKRGREALLDSANLIDDLPKAARSLMRLVQQKEFGVTLNAKEFEAIKKEIDRQSDIRFLTLFLVADLIATTVLLHFEGVQTISGIRLSLLGLIIAFVLSFLVILRIRRRPK